MKDDDSDGINETFNDTMESITVGTVTLGNCSMTSLYVNGSSSPTQDWNETILTVNNTDIIIFAAIANDNTWGFNNQSWDFQIMLGDDGNISAATTYYMYNEIT